MGKTKLLFSMMALVLVMSPIFANAQDVNDRVTVTKQVGNYNRVMNMSPLNLNQFQTMSETVYTAAELGLVEGCQIKSIAYHGYSSASGTAHVQAWIANTTDAVPVSMTAAAASDVTAMTQIYDDDYEFNQGGTSSQRVENLRFDLNEPLVYTGGNLRVVVKASTETKVGLTYFEVSSTLGSFYRNQNTTTGDLSAANFTRTNKPVLYVTYEKDMTYLSGKLYLKRKSGISVPASGATISLKGSDGTEYETITDTEGYYRVAITNDEQAYDVNVTVPGVNIFPVTDRVVMAGISATHDIEVTEAVDFYINTCDIPVTGTVNHPYTALVSATNYNGSTMEANDYSVMLLMDDKDVTHSITCDVASMDQNTFTLTFTPHEAGSYTALIQIAGPAQTVSTEEVQVTISPEFAAGDVQVLDEKAKTTTPINTYYKHSMSETVYTAEKLGLDTGAKITSLSYLSYKTIDAIDAHVQIWIENTEDGIDFTAGRATSEMTRIYDKELTIEPHGTSNELQAYIVANMEEDPFVYTGGNLRVVVQCDATVAKSMSFWADNTYKGTVNKQNDNVADASEIAWGTAKTNSPVLLISVINSVQLTGKVVNGSGEAVPDAKITLVNEEKNVVYYTTSGENGDFSVAVVQHQLPYTITAEKDGLNTTQEVAFNGEDQEVELVLDETQISTGVGSIEAPVGKVLRGVFTIDGRQLRSDANLPSGIYIINGKKVVVNK